MTPGLPRVVVTVLRWTVPRRDQAQVLADLDDDYRQVRGTRSRSAAARWLWRESASLVWAFARHAAAAVRRAGPIWSRDAQMVMRALWRAPLTTFGAAATLATGFLALLITAGLSDALLFRSVSSTHGDALRRVASIDASGRARSRFSFIEVERIRELLAGSGSVAAVNLQPVVLSADRADVQTMVEVVDGGYFGLVGAPMILGRALVSADDRFGAPPVVVLGEALWRRRFGAAASLVGRTVQLNRTSFTVVGVTAALGSASAFGAGVDAWAPEAHADALLSAGWRTDLDERWFSVFVLPSGSVAEVDNGLALAAAELARRHPDAWRGRTFRTGAARLLAGSQLRNVNVLAWTLAVLSALILAVGAANVGGVLLARAAAAERSTAIHLSMGAGRAAVVRRLLFEGALLGWIGGGGALLLYLWARRAFAQITLLPTLALRLDLPLDRADVVGVACVSGLVGALLAVGPAAWSVQTQRAAALGGGYARAAGSRGASRARRLLVSAQICVSLVLVVGAALFSRSLIALESVDVGFEKQGLVAMDFDLE
ncbi:MAG TPA: ABC transporter permease, partial [Vicinamibacterales bacterium]|nr:ABC transporter permease [Vicinamibacterales bacterium]